MICIFASRGPSYLGPYSSQGPIPDSLTSSAPSAEHRSLFGQAQPRGNFGDLGNAPNSSAGPDSTNETSSQVLNETTYTSDALRYMPVVYLFLSLASREHVVHETCSKHGIMLMRLHLSRKIHTTGEISPRPRISLSLHHHLNSSTESPLRHCSMACTTYPRKVIAIASRSAWAPD